MSHTAINPSTGTLVSTHDEISSKESGRIITRTHKAYLAWKQTDFTDRALLMRAAAQILRSRSEALAELMAIEMGKPLAQGRSEVEKCAWVCEYYADHTADFLASEEVATDASKSYVTYRPLGLVFAIMPWNFPLWQVFRFAAPTLMGGNGALLKHAPNVPGCALAIESVFRDAGFPEDLFRTLIISVPQTRSVIRHRHVAAVTLTGSTAAGKAVAKEAGARLKKCVLELGGSDPYVILDDADLSQAVEACATSRLLNSGQSCIAAKRFIVVPGVRQEFEERLVERMSRARMGNPLEDGIDIGPQARGDLREALHTQVLRSIESGARLLLGGSLPPGDGFFYPATVLTDITKGMAAYNEELFGPVASIIPVKSAKEAIKVANDTSFGLGAAIFTRDRERGERIAVEDLHAGSCFVNTFVRSDPRLPFGGIKESGIGRELARNGMLEFQNVKTIYVE